MKNKIWHLQFQKLNFWKLQWSFGFKLLYHSAVKGLFIAVAHISIHREEKCSVPEERKEDGVNPPHQLTSSIKERRILCLIRSESPISVVCSVNWKCLLFLIIYLYLEISIDVFQSIVVSKRFNKTMKHKDKSFKKLFKCYALVHCYLIFQREK